jgi:hypothetical protein
MFQLLNGERLSLKKDRLSLKKMNGEGERPVADILFK